MLFFRAENGLVNQLLSKICFRMNKITIKSHY